MILGTNSFDIITKMGGVETPADAQKVFSDSMDQANLAKISKITTNDALLKIANAIVVCQPSSIFVNTGSDADVQYIRELALKNGEESKLAMKDHTIHFDLKDEQGRIVDRTFYIANDGEQISSLANKMPRVEAAKDLETKLTGVMKGKEMVIGFYLRGPIGSQGSNRQLKSPVPLMSATVLSYFIETFMITLTRKLVGPVIFTPISTAKAQIDLKIFPMPAFLWIEATKPHIVYFAHMPVTH